MVRVAKVVGDRSLLWPKWCNGVDEVPADLVQAIAHAVFIINASENLMEGEQPEDWKWAFDDEIAAHFENVKRQREKRMKSGSSSDGFDDDAGWAQNEYARGF